MKEKFRKLQIFIKAHERHIGTGALLVGAIFDWVTITKSDSLFGIISISSYLVMAAGSILVLNIRSTRAQESPWLPITIQFCFGNLASGLLVLYTQSATLVGSWLFLLGLAALVIANEFARKRYERLRSHLIGFYVLFSAYAAFMLPILLKQIGWKIFVGSSLFSAAFIAVYVLILQRLAPARLQADWKSIVIGFAMVTVLFNGLYFGNFIPPVPLSLTDIGVYHHVSRVGDNYELLGESAPEWWNLWARLFPTYHFVDGEAVYCFSSVYAPVGLDAPIYHTWEAYNVVAHGWIVRSRISFPISGGREAGYRGFSQKNDLEPGRWRCSAETAEGALIGRQTFTVVNVSAQVPLAISIR